MTTLEVMNELPAAAAEARNAQQKYAQDIHDESLMILWANYLEDFPPPESVEQFTLEQQQAMLEVLHQDDDDDVTAWEEIYERWMLPSIIVMGSRWDSNFQN
tara:strand:- start:114 stop:419 length:306 start_codon:yes stop_codon:yes gene_type:complete